METIIEIPCQFKSQALLEYALKNEFRVHLHPGAVGAIIGSSHAAEVDISSAMQAVFPEILPMAPARDLLFAKRNILLRWSEQGYEMLRQAQSTPGRVSYSPELLDEIIISHTLLYKAMKDCGHRISFIGYRLAHVLRQKYHPPTPETIKHIDRAILYAVESCALAPEQFQALARDRLVASLKVREDFLDVDEIDRTEDAHYPSAINAFLEALPHLDLQKNESWRLIFRLCQYTFVGSKWLEVSLIGRVIDESGRLLAKMPVHINFRSELHDTRGALLSERFQRLGSKADIDQSVFYGEIAIKEIGDRDDLADCEASLATKLSVRFQFYPDGRDLFRVLQLSGSAIEKTPKNHPERASREFQYIRDCRIASVSSFAHPDLERVARFQNDIRQSGILAAKRFLQDHPADSYFGQRVVSSLALFYYDVAAATCQATLVDSAIQLLEEVIRTALTSGEAPSVSDLTILGDSYLLRRRLVPGGEEGEKARRCFLDILRHPSLSTVAEGAFCMQAGLRILSATDMLSLDRQAAVTMTKEVVQVYEKFKAFISLSSPPEKTYLLGAVFYPRGPGMGGDAAPHVSAYGGTSDAGAILLHYEGPDVTAEVAELLEVGRGFVLGPLQGQRADISGLKERHPNLADRLDSLRAQLETSSRRARFSPDTDTVSGQHDILMQMTDLLQEIRSREGLGRFLLPPTAIEMQQIAEARGPIVVINASVHRCDALLIQGAGIGVLPLRVTISDISEHAGKAITVKTLAWIWSTIARPILDRLGFTTIMALGTKDVPHVYWVPTGPFGKLPLHAAGCYGTSLEAGEDDAGHATNALDRVVSSYCSSVEQVVLAHKTRHHRQPGPGTKRPKAVLVAMDSTPGMQRGQLQFASKEIEVVQEILNTAHYNCIQPSRSRDDVAASLDDIRIFHFAGHGSATRDPLKSHMLLEDWETKPLSVETLLETNLATQSPFLAYLSACHTSNNVNEILAAESLHLGAAFRLAGFRHVIGTLWEVDDSLCVDMARETYQRLLAKNDIEDPTTDGDASDLVKDLGVSRSLNEATRKLRDSWLQSQQSSLRGPSQEDREFKHARELTDKAPSWVPYVHLGI